MSNTKKMTSGTILKSPVGEGAFTNHSKGYVEQFKNAITIYGKKHLLNAFF